MEKPPAVLTEAAFDFADAYERLRAEILQGTKPPERSADLEVDDRLRVYRAAMANPALRCRLLDCLAHDPDPLAASAPLVALLEATSLDDRAPILGAVQPGNAPFVLRRAAELALLERLSEPMTSSATDARPEELEELLGGTDWLQRRVAVEGTSFAALETLSERGRTKRVRANARQRLQQLQKRR